MAPDTFLLGGNHIWTTFTHICSLTPRTGQHTQGYKIIVRVPCLQSITNWKFTTSVRCLHKINQWSERSNGRLNYQITKSLINFVCWSCNKSIICEVREKKSLAWKKACIFFLFQPSFIWSRSHPKPNESIFSKKKKKNLCCKIS